MSVWSVAGVTLEEGLPLRQQVEQIGAQLVDPVLGDRAHRMERVEVTEAAPAFIPVTMWLGFRLSTLFSAMITGTPSP